VSLCVKLSIPCTANRFPWYESYMSTPFWVSLSKKSFSGAMVRVMMWPAIRHGFICAGDNINRSWKWSCAKKFITSSYDLGWRQTFYQNCIAGWDLKLCSWQVYHETIWDC
jgi:hypothetical protein